MTQDYRKRAEELWAYFKQQGPREYELDMLVAVFSEVAHEARQKAIDECFKIIKSYLVEQKTIYENVVSYAFSNPEDILKDIKNRMIGPEPMEQK